MLQSQWRLAGSTLKGAGLGAITGFVGGQFIGAGANVPQNITDQTVRHVVSAGVEAGVETVIDTGISVATGNPISLKNVATDYGLNLITNGSGSVSSKKGAKTSRPKVKPKAGDVEVLDAGYQHHRPFKDVTPPTKSSQKLLDGPRADTPRLEAPKIEYRKLSPEEAYLYRRPTHYRKNMKSDTWNNAVSGGEVRDSVTGLRMKSDEPWQMGHKPGYEFRKHQVSAANRGISRKEFLDEYNNPHHFRPERLY